MNLKLIMLRIVRKCFDNLIAMRKSFQFVKGYVSPLQQLECNSPRMIDLPQMAVCHETLQNSTFIMREAKYLPLSFLLASRAFLESNDLNDLSEDQVIVQYLSVEYST